MELSWLESLIYGLVSGLVEFLPISAEAHRALFLKLVGAREEPALRLAVHIGALLALLISCAPMLSKLRRERRIASVPKKRRKRQPDLKTMLDIRLLRTALVPLLLTFVAYPVLSDITERLWILAILLGVNGILLYTPQFIPGANKDSQSLSSLDAVVIGLGSGIGAVPGISRVSATLFASHISGTERRYALDICFLLCIPSLIVLLLFDCWWLIAGTGSAVSFILILQWITAAAAAFGTGYFAIFIMRFLSVKAGFSGFAYYCWGAALFALILYLLIF